MRNGNQGPKRAYVTLRQTTQKAIHLHPLKKSKLNDWRDLFLFYNENLRTDCCFFLGTHYHISGPTRQWIECASNFPAVRTGSSRGNPHINGIINTSIGSFRKMFFSEYFSGRMRRKVAGSWQTSNTKNSFEGCLIIKKNAPEQNANFRAVSFARSVYPSLSLRIAFHGWSLLTWNLSSFTLIVVI